LNKRQLAKWRETYTVWDNPCTGEGLRLAVHFDEKDDVKRLGGRWSPAPNGAKGGFWWMPAKRLNDDCPIPCEIMGDGWGGTIEDWLNNHKMIFSQYGKQDSTLCDQAVQGGGNPETYRLECTEPTNGAQEVFWYAELGICAFRQAADHNQFDWYSAEDGRKQWDLLVATGYYRTVLEESA